MLITMVISAMAIASGQQATPATDTYTDSQLGLSFAHPTTWLLETPNDSKSVKAAKKKKKKDGDMVDFRIPLTGAVDDADLQIMRASFSGTADTWQTVQTDANKNLHRQVERQWQQEILGVPLLLTKINYTENGNNRTTVTGLLYNESASKLLFRLTGPTSDFDKAQYEFDQAMQTLRTTNNELPKAQDPYHPVAKVTKADLKGLKHPLFVASTVHSYKVAPVAVPLTVSTKKIEVRVPEGWSASHLEASSFELQSAALPYPIMVRVASSLDSEPAGTALLNASAASLSEFTSVKRREDTTANVNVGGCTVTSIWRTGTGSKGPLVTMEAAGSQGDFYFVATCHPSTDASNLTQRKAIDELLHAISIKSVE
jgi:hypothetical protein